MKELPNGFEWCRKSKYQVQIELACYQITETQPLIDGFESQEFEIDGEKKLFAVKRGFNILEQNSWITSPTRPYVVTGTSGERWPIKASNLSAYDVEVEQIGLTPIIVETKDPSDQQFLVAVFIPDGTKLIVTPSWAFQKDGTIDKTQFMYANSEDSKVPHNGGDYVVAKHIDGQPEYMQLTEEQRNTREAAKLYDPRIINGSIMQITYDHALTQEEIIDKYNTMSL